MRTAVYIRVSTEDQAREGFSIPAQREKLLAYAHSQDWTVTRLYVDEGVSAKDMNRPQLARLLADVRSGGIDVVLVYRLDRLTRSVLDLYQLLQEFERCGVRFKSCTEVYDTTTAMGRLFITLVAALAQWERENLAERVKLGMEQMVKERKRPGGPAPYGYNLRDGALAIVPEEAAAVRMMFEQYASGETPRKIAEQANCLGARGKNGAPWSASAVLRLLKNPVYYGALRWNYADAEQKPHPQKDWLLQKSAHPAIIDEQLFTAVKQKMEQRSTRHPRVLSSPFLFSGLLYCSSCGSPMRGKASRNHAHIYYSCAARQSGACHALPIREDRLADAVLAQLRHYTAEAMAAAAAVLRSQRQAAPSDGRQTEKALTQKRRRWEEAYAEGLISLTDFRAKLAELKAASALPLADLAQEAAHPLAGPDEISLLANWEWIWDEATREERRQLATSLIERIEATASPFVPHARKRGVQVIFLRFR
ncbi:recombinase family protein [Brevibacillus sp. GCM10020057]|uniref:recombinase family protein n=1 Tax=Brevibacillus sp. GCM10020057 TaxID=3317327 RepID=UPI00364568AB